jgi:2,4-dienoyl-CoA reductase (NADPH2)
MVSMARPFLADAAFVNKASEGRADEINTCIACNQACLDTIFAGSIASCLVNPRACHETEIVIEPTPTPRKIAVVGAGPAGMACATTAAERGHAVTLFDAAKTIGGQFNLARRIPGKEEFSETLRFFSHRLRKVGVTVRLGQRVDIAELVQGGYDHVVLATGIVPRTLDVPGSDHAKVASYVDLITGRKIAGGKVAIVGAGGIGFDVGEFLTHTPSPAGELERFQAEWGIDTARGARGGLKPAEKETSARQVWLLQRKASKVGANLARTTGWIRRALLKMRGVEMLAGVSYERIDDAGLHIRVDGEARCLPVDTVVVCAGQEPCRELEEGLRAAGIPMSLIGGADVAIELDAQRAIAQGTRLAIAL